MAWKDKHGRAELVMHPNIKPVIAAAAVRSVPALPDDSAADVPEVSGRSDSVAGTENAQGAREGEAADHLQR